MSETFNPESDDIKPEVTGGYPIFTLRNSEIAEMVKMAPDKIEGNRITMVRKIDPELREGDRIDLVGLDARIVPTKIKSIKKIDTESQSFGFNIRGDRKYVPIIATIVLERISNDTESK
jgi:hypothetical protein